MILLSVVSCSRKPATKEQPGEAVAKETTGKYELETGIIEYKSSMMGFDATQTLYFDSYGQRESTETHMEVMGMKTHTITIVKDGIIYTYEPEKKTGTQVSATGGPVQINFRELTDELREKMNIREEGTETVLGRPCTKYSVDDLSMNMKGYYWIWKGIPLKMDVDLGMSKMVMEALSMEENADIPAERFEVPAGITMQGPGAGVPR